MDDRDPIDDFRILQTEIGIYRSQLLDRPSLIFANKLDVRSDACQQNLERLKQLTSIPVVAGSALHKWNLDPMIASLFQLVDNFQ